MRQQRFMGAELGRKKLGRPTKTGMSTAQLRDFATGPVKPPKPGSAVSPPKKAKAKSADFHFPMKVRKPPY